MSSTTKLIDKYLGEAKKKKKEKEDKPLFKWRHLLQKKSERT